MAGGVHGRGRAWQGCVLDRGHAWQEGGHMWEGVCMVEGMHGRGALCGRGACVAGGTATGMHSCFIDKNKMYSRYLKSKRFLPGIDWFLSG